MPEPMSEERLAEIEAQHARSDDERWDCRYCGDKYPCETMDLIAEVRRLRRSEPDGYIDIKCPMLDGTVMVVPTPYWT